MTMLASEPAICKNCGNKQRFTKVISWNVCLDPKYPANNKCCQCGTEIEYDDIDMLTCSPFHREEVRRKKIYDRYLKEENNDDEEDTICPKCGSNRISYGFGVRSLPEKYKNEKDYVVQNGYYQCEECGHITYETIEDILSSGLFEFIENGENEHEYIVKRVDNYQDIINKLNKQKEEKLDKIENELILEGLITTREEEKEYSNKYFKKLEEKLFGSDSLKKFE